MRSCLGLSDRAKISSKLSFKSIPQRFFTSSTLYCQKNVFRPLVSDIICFAVHITRRRGRPSLRVIQRPLNPCPSPPSPAVPLCCAPHRPLLLQPHPHPAVIVYSCNSAQHGACTLQPSRPGTGQGRDVSLSNRTHRSFCSSIKVKGFPQAVFQLIPPPPCSDGRGKG